MSGKGSGCGCPGEEGAPRDRGRPRWRLGGAQPGVGGTRCFRFPPDQLSPAAVPSRAALPGPGGLRSAGPTRTWAAPSRGEPGGGAGVRPCVVGNALRAARVPIPGSTLERDAWLGIVFLCRARRWQGEAAESGGAAPPALTRRCSAPLKLRCGWKKRHQSGH